MVSYAQYRQTRLVSTEEVTIHRTEDVVMALSDSDTLPFLQTRNGDGMHGREHDESSEGT